MPASAFRRRGTFPQGLAAALGSAKTYEDAALALGLSHFWKFREAAGLVAADSVAGGVDLAWGADVSGFLTPGPDPDTQVPVNNGVANRVAIAAAINVPTTATYFWWERKDVNANDDAMIFEFANSPTFSQFVQEDENYSGVLAGGVGGGKALVSVNYGNPSGAAGAWYDRGVLGVWDFYCLAIDPSLTAANQVKVYRIGTIISSVVGITEFSQGGLVPGAFKMGVLGRNNNGARALPIKAAVYGLGIAPRILTAAEMTSLFETLGGKGFASAATTINHTASDPDYSAFPSLARLAAGSDLIVVYYKGATHLSGDGKIYAKDRVSGAWVNERIIAQITGKDCRDPSVSRLASGRLLATFSAETTPGNLSDEKAYLIKSDDDGVTWKNIDGSALGSAAPTTRLNGGYTPNFEVVAAKVVEAANGDLYVPVYGSASLGAGGVPSSELVAKVLRSVDGGATWTVRATISVAGKNMDEPQLMKIPGTDRWVLSIRGSAFPDPGGFGADKQIMFAFSTDDCATWTAPVAKFAGLSACRVTWTGHALIAVYRENAAAERTLYRYSFDQGANWRNEIVVDAGISNYGDVVAGLQGPAADGDVVMVYAQELTGSIADLKYREFKGGA